MSEWMQVLIKNRGPKNANHSLHQPRPRCVLLHFSRDIAWKSLRTLISNVLLIWEPWVCTLWKETSPLRAGNPLVTLSLLGNQGTSGSPRGRPGSQTWFTRASLASTGVPLPQMLKNGAQTAYHMKIYKDLCVFLVRNCSRTESSGLWQWRGSDQDFFAMPLCIQSSFIHASLARRLFRIFRKIASAWAIYLRVSWFWWQCQNVFWEVTERETGGHRRKPYRGTEADGNG